MNDIVKSYLRMVENPAAAKVYSDLAHYYKSKGMAEETAAFEALLKERFTNEANGSSSNSQQPDHT